MQHVATTIIAWESIIPVTKATRPLVMTGRDYRENDHSETALCQPAFLRMASLHFCQECNNLLYPRADPQRRIMVYACRICPYDEIGENKCVYKNDLLKVTKEQVGITQDLGADPTLPHSNISCPRCGHEDAVFYQDQSKRKETRMILFFVCVKCNHSFIDPTLPEENKPDF